MFTFLLSLSLLSQAPVPAQEKAPLPPEKAQVKPKAQPPKAVTKAQLRAKKYHEDVKALGRIERLLNQPLVPGTVLFVGPFPGETFPVGLTWHGGISMLRPYFKGDLEQLVALEDKGHLTWFLVPAKVKVIKTEAVVTNTFTPATADALTSEVSVLDGPLKGKHIWVAHAGFYVLPEKIAEMSYDDRKKLWESIVRNALSSRGSRPRSKGRQAKGQPKAKEKVQPKIKALPQD